MTSVETLINQFIAVATDEGDTSEFSYRLSELVAAKDLTLLQLIQTLGPSLTSDDVYVRSHSVHCLVATLNAISASGHLSKQDVCVLVQFLSAKLDDEKVSVHVLNGLGSLALSKAFIPHLNGNLETILKAVSSRYEPRKHLAKVRYEAFNLLHLLFESHSDNIATSAEYANLYVSTFNHVASGEKDPRNLLMSFKLNTAINKKVVFEARSMNKQHDQLLTDLFDVAFCYFPISFSPPENDPYKITAADLKAELRNTIASQSQFSQDTFPSLFEKLTSTNPSVRNDVLQTLFQCINEYSASTIEEYWVTIWDSLKFEILHNDMLSFRPEADYIISPYAAEMDDADETKSLMFTLLSLSAVVQKLAAAESDLLTSLITTVIEGLKPNYLSLNEKTLKPSVLLMTSMGSASLQMFNNVVDTLFSFEVWGKYIRSDFSELEKQDPEDEVDIALTVASQRELIDNLGFVFTAYKTLDEPNNLLNYKDHLLVFMGQLLQASSKLEKTLKCKLTQQLIKLLLLPEFLTREDSVLVLTWLGENLSAIISGGDNNWESDILLTEITNGLILVMTQESEESSNNHVSAVVDTILPGLLEMSSEPGVLQLVSKLCVSFQFLEVLSIRFLNKLAYDGFDEAVYKRTVTSLIEAFNKTQSIKPFLTNSWYDKFLPRFLATTIEKAGEDFIILELSGRLIGLIIRYIDKAKHQSILEQFVPFFYGEKSFCGVSIESVFTAPTPKITLMKHVLAKIDRNTTLPAECESAAEICAQVSFMPSNDFVRNGYLQVLSILINKFTKQGAQSNDELLKVYFDKADKDVSQLEVAVWILKGLVNKIDPVSHQYVESLVERLMTSTNTDYCFQIIRSFNIMMADLESFMNVENSKPKIISGVMNLNVRLLYKQQIFESILPKLIKSFGSASDVTRREICLGTLATMIDNVSTKILRPHLQQIFPLVLDGLTYENALILRASLLTFKVIIFEAPELIQENLGSLVKKLVDLVVVKVVVDRKLVNTGDIRLLSLECLEGLFIKLELAQVIKYQVPTRNSLSSALDDPKRVVRKKTCDVRQVLYEMGR